MQVEVTQADIDAAAPFIGWHAYEHPLERAFARHRIAERKAIVDWLRELAHYPASALEGHPPRGEVWVLHRSADAIERGEHTKGQAHD